MPKYFATHFLLASLLVGGLCLEIFQRRDEEYLDLTPNQWWGQLYESNLTHDGSSLELGKGITSHGLQQRNNFAVRIPFPILKFNAQFNARSPSPRENVDLSVGLDAENVMNSSHSLKGHIFSSQLARPDTDSSIKVVAVNSGPPRDTYEGIHLQIIEVDQAMKHLRDRLDEKEIERYGEQVGEIKRQLRLDRDAWQSWFFHTYPSSELPHGGSELVKLARSRRLPQSGETLLIAYLSELSFHQHEMSRRRAKLEPFEFAELHKLESKITGLNARLLNLKSQLREYVPANLAIPEDWPRHARLPLTRFPRSVPVNQKTVLKPMCTSPIKCRVVKLGSQAVGVLDKHVGKFQAGLMLIRVNRCIQRNDSTCLGLTTAMLGAKVAPKLASSMSKALMAAGHVRSANIIGTVAKRGKFLVPRALSIVNVILDARQLVQSFKELDEGRPRSAVQLGFNVLDLAASSVQMAVVLTGAACPPCLATVAVVDAVNLVAYAVLDILEISDRVAEFRQALRLRPMEEFEIGLASFFGFTKKEQAYRREYDLRQLNLLNIKQYENHSKLYDVDMIFFPSVKPGRNQAGEEIKETHTVKTVNLRTRYFIYPRWSIEFESELVANGTSLACLPVLRQDDEAQAAITSYHVQRLPYCENMLGIRHRNSTGGRVPRARIMLGEGTATAITNDEYYTWFTVEEGDQRITCGSKGSRIGVAAPNVTLSVIGGSGLDTITSIDFPSDKSHSTFTVSNVERVYGSAGYQEFLFADHTVREIDLQSGNKYDGDEILIRCENSTEVEIVLASSTIISLKDTAGVFYYNLVFGKNETDEPSESETHIYCSAFTTSEHEHIVKAKANRNELTATIIATQSSYFLREDESQVQICQVEVTHLPTSHTHTLLFHDCATHNLSGAEFFACPEVFTNDEMSFGQELDGTDE